MFVSDKFRRDSGWCSSRFRLLKAYKMAILGTHHIIRPELVIIPLYRSSPPTVEEAVAHASCLRCCRTVPLLNVAASADSAPHSTLLEASCHPILEKILGTRLNRAGATLERPQDRSPELEAWRSLTACTQANAPTKQLQYRIEEGSFREPSGRKAANLGERKLLTEEPMHGSGNPNAHAA